MGEVTGTRERTRGSDQRREVQLLTARALMLALDPSQSTSEAAAELARFSQGDTDTLDVVAEQVRELAAEHPGPDARRARRIVDDAQNRVASLRRHPSNPTRSLVST